MTRVSIAITTWEAHGQAVHFLNRSLQKIREQTYPLIEVVISDHSVDDAVKDCVDRNRQLFPEMTIVYSRNPNRRGSFAANQNNAFRQSSGELIKALCLDDYLLNNSAIAEIVSAFASFPDKKWMVGTYLHTRDGHALYDPTSPMYSPQLALGNNSFGCPTCLTIRKEILEMEMFDEELIWLVDCEYYERLWRRFGEPIFLHQPTAVNFLHGGQVTHVCDDALRRNEKMQVARKLGISQ